jgi:p-cumate 2,3-dioxygenase beta subunit
VHRVEQFLYAEADLLDEWRLDDWLALLTDDIRYTVPSTDLPAGDPESDLVLIDDDMTRLRARVLRLKSRMAHREFPTSRTRRLITNVRVVGDRGEEIDVTANYVVYRIRQGTSAYMGKYRYTLVRAGEAFLIRYRRAEIDLETLTPHGTVSIIL